MTKLKGSHQPLKRTILYYPSISIPAGRWLRQSLLYWDEVASIVPTAIENRADNLFSPDIEFLKGEGEYRAIRPDELIINRNAWEQLHNFEQDFIARASSERFQRILGPREGRIFNAAIYQGKVSINLYHTFLEEQGLAIEVPGNYEEYLFEPRAALLYMSLLAKHLAAVDSEATIPGTDRDKYEVPIFSPLSANDSYTCFDAYFHNLLPVPRNDVPLDEIIIFKHQRRQELLKFRTEVDAFQKQLAEAEKQQEIRSVAIQFQERLERETSELSALMKDSRLATVAGSFKTLIDLKSPALWGTATVLAGHATKITEIPMNWSLSGMAMLGVVQIGAHLVERSVVKNTTLRNSAFAYVYHASSEGLI